MILVSKPTIILQWSFLFFYSQLEALRREGRTKIEYTFVWKKAVTKNTSKLLQKIADLIAECEELYGMKIVHNNMVKMKHVKKFNKKR